MDRNMRISDFFCCNISVMISAAVWKLCTNDTSPHEHKPIRIKNNVIYNRSKIIWSKNNPDYFTTKKPFVPTLWNLGDTPGSWYWLSQEGRAVTACGSVLPLPARPRRWGLHSGTGPTLQLRRRPRHPIKSNYSTVESYNKIPPKMATYLLSKPMSVHL